MHDLWHFLSTMSRATVDKILLGLCAFSAMSALSILVVKRMPLSGREATPELEALGKVNKRLGWILMEIPILLTTALGYLAGSLPTNPGTVILGFFVAHYIHRALIFPFRIKTDGKTLPVVTVVMTMLFYIVNGYLVGYYFSALAEYPASWLYDPRFVAGALMFLAGFAINLHSDDILIKLRGDGETGYKIPQGGFFRYVTCANYFGECVEWIGFALMSWNRMGLTYAILVVPQLLAQSRLAHQWYKRRFGEAYPASRRAIIPGVW